MIRCLLFIPIILALTGCGERPPARGADGAPGKDNVSWVVTDWSEWKKQDTGPAAKVEVKMDLPETDPPPADTKREPLPEAAKKAGVLVLGAGEPFSAVRYDGKRELPLKGYEISWDSMRVDGNDFFSALTFPVGAKDRCVSFVNGGWGGYVVGITAINHQFASENETTRSMEFKTGRWYRFTVQCTPDVIRALIDGKEQFKVTVKDRQLSMHPSEIDKCVPLGFASYSTTGAIRHVNIRELNPGELEPDPEEN